MRTTPLDFSAVRRRADFETVLDHYGLKLVRTGMRYFILCPFHRETTPSCSIHLAKRIFYCFGCAARGTIIDFVAMVEQINLQAAATKLSTMRIEARGSGDRRSRRLDQYEGARTPDSQNPNPPVPHPFSLNPTHPYLTARGLASELIDEFGLGYCDRGPMRRRICIPIHNAGGKLVSYAGRWAGDPVPNGVARYLLSKGFRKRHVLFNLHRLLPGDHIVLVEGYWSVFRLHSLGVPVAGLMGSAISPEQIALLSAKNIRFVTLLMDGDRAGWSCREKITPVLSQQFSVFAPVLPTSQKPDRMSVADLAALTSSFVKI